MILKYENFLNLWKTLKLEDKHFKLLPLSLLFSTKIFILLNNKLQFQEKKVANTAWLFYLKNSVVVYFNQQTGALHLLCRWKCYFFFANFLFLAHFVVKKEKKRKREKEKKRKRKKMLFGRLFSVSFRIWRCLAQTLITTKHLLN